MIIFPYSIFVTNKAAFTLVIGHRDENASTYQYYISTNNS